MSEIDALWAGLLGGFIGSSLIIATLYFTFSNRYREYFFNKEHFKTRLAVNKLQEDVVALKIQMVALQNV